MTNRVSDGDKQPEQAASMTRVLKIDLNFLKHLLETMLRA